MGYVFEKYSLGGSGSGGPGASITTVGGWQGTAVPNTGTVDKIYFNTALSIEEVVALCEQLSFTPMSETESIYGIVGSVENSYDLLVVKFEGEGLTAYAIVKGLLFGSGQAVYFSSMSNENLTAGWQGVDNVTLSFPVISSYEGVVVGAQNDLISSLVSTTPFVYSEGVPYELEGEYDGATITEKKAGVLDIKALLDEKKLPLNINFKPVTESLTVTENGTYTPSGIMYANYRNSYNASDFAPYKDIYVVGDDTLANGGVYFSNTNGEVIGITSISELGWHYYSFIQNTNYPIVGWYELDLTASKFKHMPTPPVFKWTVNLINDVPTELLNLLLTDIETIPSVGFDSVKVKTVAKNQDKSITVNGQYFADSGYSGLGIVTVNVPQTSITNRAYKIGTPISLSNPPEKIYINTSLTAAEVDEILAKITAWNGNAYYVYKTDDAWITIYRNPNTGECLISVKQSGSSSEITFYVAAAGWQGEALHFTGLNVAGTPSILEYNGKIVGSQNDLLYPIFSSSPFQDYSATTDQAISGQFDSNPITIYENGTVDISKMTEQDGKLPLAINVSTPSEGSNLETLTVTENGIYETPIRVIGKFKSTYDLSKFDPYFTNKEDISYITPQSLPITIVFDHYIWGEGDSIAIDIYHPIVRKRGHVYTYYQPTTSYPLAWYDNAPGEVPVQLSGAPDATFDFTLDDIQIDGYENKIAFLNLLLDDIKFYPLAAHPYIDVKVPKDGLSPTTVTEADVLSGKTFYDGDGVLRTGTKKNWIKRYYDSNGNSVKGLLSGYTGTTTEGLIDYNDTSEITTFAGMFSQSTKTIETISNFDTSKAKYMRDMCKGCSKLVNVPLFDTSNVIWMDSMFEGCSSLKTIPLFNTCNLEAAVHMFRDCLELTTIPALNFRSNTEWLGGFVYKCPKLTEIWIKNIRADLEVSDNSTYGTLITKESLIHLIKELWDLTGQTGKTLTIGNTNLAKITDVYVKTGITPTAEQLAEDPDLDMKVPCEVCESTDNGAMSIIDYATSKNWTIA